MIFYIYVYNIIKAIITLNTNRCPFQTWRIRAMPSSETLLAKLIKNKNILLFIQDMDRNYSKSIVI